MAAKKVPAKKTKVPAKKVAAKATKKVAAKAVKKVVAKAAKKAAPKKPAAKAIARRTMTPEERERYKVSPLRGMELDKWFAATVSGWQADVVRRVVAMVKRVVPSATVEIKWRQPVFAVNGKDFVFVRAAKEHVAIGLWRGIAVDDPKGLLDGSRFHRVTDPSAFDEKAFTEIVKQAARARA